MPACRLCGCPPGTNPHEPISCPPARLPGSQTNKNYLLIASPYCHEHLPYPPPAPDPHSFARGPALPHLALTLAVDFANQTLAGAATWHLAAPTVEATELVLDTRDLVMEGAWADAAGTGPAVAYALGPADATLGRALHLPLPAGTAAVRLAYRTSPHAAALQWLAPAQTAGQHPFLFTQSQAILARTWLPCPDSPGRRFTYEAEVEILGAERGQLLALMSATNPQALAADGCYHFRQPRPVPAYLLALAVGRLDFAPLSERTGIYAELATLPRATHEFSELNRMVAAAEQLYGPYRWGRYDLLLLPASFPFGGMENPCLTFVTPTILAGDRSLTSLVAHELAHSWSGNLVTNATWNDFWLNEGFTVYFERRIMEQLHGRPYADMLQVLGEADLHRTLRELGPGSAATHLRQHLAGRDPDDGLTDIAYEKGCLLLLTLEHLVGRPRLDAFITEYFARFAFQSLDTDRFCRLPHPDAAHARRSRPPSTCPPGSTAPACRPVPRGPSRRGWPPWRRPWPGWPPARRPPRCAP